ncbi:Mu transposase domain-containing protein [Streptomyces sp. 796.1]|uniref:Mu transposase domain-containing protein n=1 Tax=Streptomyces sp. 796.1 TaxID=3163029 RepID=UPI0039C9AA23
MKMTDREIIEILVAYDATESVYSAARIVGCDPKTVRRYVAARDAGRPVTGPSRRSRLADAYAEKIEEWVDRSEGHISAVRAHERLVRMGFTGSERTTRRVVAEAKSRWRSGSRRIYRPWVAEPGLWLQYDWGPGPLVPGPDGEPRRTALFSAWLAWSRYRVVIPCRDRTLGSLVCCLDSTLTTLGGAPTYLLTRLRPDGGTRHPDVVAAGRHYGMKVRTCVPHDPEGGSTQAGVRVAAADLAPTDADLRREYASFAELQAACQEFGQWFNGQVRHWQGQRPATEAEVDPEQASETATPAQRLAVERNRLHPLPSAPCTLGIGQQARVGERDTVAYDMASYAVPADLVGNQVWLRATRGELVVVADLAALPNRPAHLAGADGLTEVARHRISRAVVRGALH